MPFPHNAGMRPPVRQLPRALFAALVLFRLHPAGAADAEPPNAAAEYLIDTWQSDDGLPQNSVIAMAQTADGYLWLSTFGGLARFDGRRFDVFETEQIPELAGEVFTTFRADSAGNLWMRGTSGATFIGRNGVFRKLGRADGLLADGARAGNVAPDGTLWTGDTAGRLLKYDRGRFNVVKEAPPTPDWGPLAHVQIDEAGIVWTWSSTACARLAAGQWQEVLKADKGDAVILVKPLRDGSVVLAVGNQLLRYTGGVFSKLGPVPPGFDGRWLSEDPNGDWWCSVYSYDGVLRRDVQGRWTHFTRASGLPTDTIRGTLLDREGNRWFGTDGAGLIRLKPRAFRSVGLAEGMKQRVALSISGVGTNSVWVATLGGGLGHFDGNRFSPVVVPPRLGPKTAVWSVRTARGGGVWFGLWSPGLYFLNAEGTGVQRFTADEHPGMITGPIGALFEASNGDLWIGSVRGGLARRADGQFRSWGAANGLASSEIHAIAEDRSGAIWIGREAGLDRIAGENTRRFTVADGLAGKAVLALATDSQGLLWIGGRELTRFKAGRFSTIRTGDGLPATSIKAIIEDDLGHLWLATPHGIMRASLGRLNEFCDTGKGSIDFSLFTKADGLPSIECSGHQPAAWKGADGRLWFATLNGLAVIDPRHLPHNEVAPPVVIEAVLADDKPQALPRGPAPGGLEPNPVLIPAGTARLEFRFAALSYTAPEKNQYRYRLENFDSDWTRAGIVPTASYTRPPPGHYLFHVCACNNDEVWNQSGAMLAVAVQPFFWQTGWFLTLSGTVLGGLIYGVVRGRLAQMERRRLAQETFARRVIESQEAERQRIARELHDGVGQTLLLVKNRLTLGIEKIRPVHPGREQIDRATVEVSEAIEEIRVTVRALRPVELDHLGLAKALEAMLERIGRTTRMRFSHDLDDAGKSVGGDVEIHLYRIAQEAVNNVLKHSQASEVHLELKREARTLRLTVQDDGAGFDPAAAQGSAGSGLPGMAERARLIGAELSVTAAPGKGCRLTLAMPLLKEFCE